MSQPPIPLGVYLVRYRIYRTTHRAPSSFEHIQHPSKTDLRPHLQWRTTVIDQAVLMGT